MQDIVRTNTYYHTNYTQKATMDTSPGKLSKPKILKLKRSLKVSKINQKSNFHFFEGLKAVL